MSILKLCQVKDHNEQLISHLCLFKKCQNDFRWACSLCLEKEFHKHGYLNNNHVMNRQQLIQLLQLQIVPFNKLISQIKQNFFTLTRKQINRIINFNQNNNNKEQVLKYNNHRLYQQNEQQMQKQFRKKPIGQLLNYELYFEQLMPCGGINFHTSYISPNEEFLIFCVGPMIFLFNLLTKQALCQRRIQYQIHMCSFNKNSNYVLCGNNQGWLFRFKLKQNLKLVDRQFYFTIFRNKIMIIEPCLLISLSDGSLKIINYKSKKQQQIIHSSTENFIWAFDYSQKQQILIYVQSFNNTKFIKFMKITNLHIIIFQEFRKSKSIKTLKNDQLISIDSQHMDSNIYLWQINYAGKQLQLLKTFHIRSVIYNLQYYREVDKIFVQCRNSIKIINSDLEIVQNIKHKLICINNLSNLFCLIFYQDHLISQDKSPSINYILLTTGGVLNIWKLKNV